MPSRAGPAVLDTRRAVRGALAGRPARVLVACSGGADSLALAAATADVAGRMGIPAGLLSVDHDLQTGSAQRAQRVAEIGAELGLDPSEAVRVTVDGPGGPEAAARAARFAALGVRADALGAHVLLGHTRDDQAETVLLGLGRGSGPRSIAGMSAADGRWLRPFLGLRRATTRAACSELGLAAWDDPHNVDPRYQRVRLRTEVLPLLEEVLQGGVIPALARTADLLRDDLDALDSWAAAAFESASAPAGGDSAGAAGGTDDCRPLDVRPLLDVPRAVRTRVLRRWARAAGAENLSAERTAALDALLVDWHGQGPVDLPGGVTARRASGTLVASPDPPAHPETSLEPSA